MDQISISSMTTTTSSERKPRYMKETSTYLSKYSLNEESVENSSNSAWSSQLRVSSASSRRIPKSKRDPSV